VCIDSVNINGSRNVRAYSLVLDGLNKGSHWPEIQDFIFVSIFPTLLIGSLE
jgi:hypothetical protein